MRQPNISLENLKSAMETEASLPSDASSDGKKGSVQPEEQKILRTAQKDSFGRSYGTGKRKNAVARVWIKAGSGKITVNGRSEEIYFARPVLRMIINQPFERTNRLNQFDVECTVSGGGLSGQAGAVRHGISKALSYYDPELRIPLKTEGLLRRDPRMVERKKPGRPKARKSFQFSKR